MRKLALILPIVALVGSIFALRQSSRSLEKTDRSLKNAQQAYRQVKAYYEPVRNDRCDFVYGSDCDKDIGLWVSNTFDDTPILSDESIRRLCNSGRICEIMGHQYMQSDLMHDDKTGLVHQSYRCRLCGAGWERSGRDSDLLPKWEDAD